MNIGTLRPAYFARRVRQMAYERSHPGAPWLTPAANRLLDGYLKPSDKGLEWGSGRSTAWLAARVGHLVSVEDNATWHTHVTRQLNEGGYASKVDYRLIPCAHQEIDEPPRHPYADVASELADASLDFVLVDGNIRETCMRAAMPKIRAGGILILDNANRYIPNREGAGNSTVHEPRNEPRTPAWGSLLEELRPWRWINTSDGIWDTRFWMKPCVEHGS